MISTINLPVTYDLPPAYRGDAYGPISLKIKDSSGNYISLAGNTIDLHVKNKKNCAIVLSWSTSDGSIELIDDYTIILSQVISCYMGMPPGKYDYDLQILNNKSTKTYLKGTLSVLGDVTNVVFCDCEYNGGSAIKLDDSFCPTESIP